MVGYRFIYSILVSCCTHFIRIMLINHLKGLLVGWLLYHVVYAFIIGIIWWEVLRFLIIRPDRFVHLFLKFIMVRCIHLFLNWRKPTSNIDWGASIRLLLRGNALPMMWLPGNIGLWTLVPMNVAYFSLFKSVGILVVFHQSWVQSELFGQSVLAVSAFLWANLQFRDLLSQGRWSCLIVLIFVHTLLGGRNTSTKLNMRTAFHPCLFANHAGKLMSFYRPTTCVGGRIATHGHLSIALQGMSVINIHRIFNIPVILCNCELWDKLLTTGVIILL